MRNLPHAASSGLTCRWRHSACWLVIVGVLPIGDWGQFRNVLPALTQEVLRTLVPVLAPDLRMSTEQ
jgi:hypothetical protein